MQTYASSSFVYMVSINEIVTFGLHFLEFKWENDLEMCRI